jgi:hypothetical protein
MRVLHQAGHNTVWNTKSLLEDECGDGIIFSPVHSDMNSVSKHDLSLKRCSLFDPQFYVPNSQKSKLKSYDFFPEKIMSGFETVDYQAIAHESARLCVNFQIEQDFSDIIIPTRFFEDLLTDFIERQKAFTVEPFLNELSTKKTTKDVYISLSLTAPMLIDKRFRTSILNWVSAYQEIEGIYLQVDFGESTKQVQDYEKLNSYITFIEELINADLEVICGYVNVEGLLATVLDINAVTMGAYENTRIFSIDKFLINDTIKMGPAPRIYLPNLLNWVRYDTAVEIKDDFPRLWDKIYTPTSYSESVLSDTRKPHFSQSPLYKHYFLLISQQYKSMAELAKRDRVALLTEQVRTANALYEELVSNRVLFFDNNCKGDHLIAWNRVLRNIHNSL